VQEAQLLDELRRLPLRHSVVAQLLAVLDDPESSADDVARSLELDPSLCVRVLHLANSPYFGLVGKVGNVERAVIALGGSVIRSLAVSTAAGLFSERAEQMPDGFWAHSVAVAAASALVAQSAGAPPGEALCAGLLHDLGSALAFRFCPDEHAACAALGIDRVLAAELAAFGADPRRPRRGRTRRLAPSRVHRGRDRRAPR
jgi:HD-like signal output (HDOD) protein